MQRCRWVTPLYLQYVLAFERSPRNDRSSYWKLKLWSRAFNISLLFGPISPFLSWEVINFINNCSSDFTKVKNVVDETGVMTRHLKIISFSCCLSVSKQATHCVACYTLGFSNSSYSFCIFQLEKVFVRCWESYSPRWVLDVTNDNLHEWGLLKSLFIYIYYNNKYKWDYRGGHLDSYFVLNSFLYRFLFCLPLQLFGSMYPFVLGL